MLDNTKIINILKQAKIEFSDSILKQFQSEIYNYVFFWPKMNYKHDIDFCGSFYEFVLDQSEQIIFSYPVEAEILFSTWFNGVLLNKYRDFCKTQKFEYFESIEDHPNLVAHEEDNIQSSYIREIERQLPSNKASFFKLITRPYSINTKDLDNITQYTKQEYYKILSCYHEILIIYDKQKIQNSIRNEKIDKINHRLDQYSYLLKKYSCENKQQEYSSKIARLNNRKNKLYRYALREEKELFHVFSLIFDNYYTAYRIWKNFKNEIKYLKKLTYYK